ncbi:hypothetical protein HaLaN_09797 [Haematococcus lacustris]|uniref:Uncharacterized protein n=1 Tax=Haematococcus lacustris TaxID=44745 RepID=A0A699ZE79_HAELA|nr:hypothetical protein HaLaN_09797 [Haematococcus lacustris]
MRYYSVTQPPQPAHLGRILTFSGLVLALAQLSHLVSDPVLLPQLRHLDVADAKLLTVPDGDQLPVSPFAASQLQSLSISWTSWELLPHLAPLAPHLTQLQASYVCLNALTAKEEEKALVTSNLAAAVSPLTGLQWLHLDLLSDYKVVAALLPLLAQMPSLHTLLLSGSEVEGDAQLDALLALTQLTRLRCFNISDLACSRASAACSWRQLELRDTDWVTAAYLPLHSLTHPLNLTFSGLVLTLALTTTQLGQLLKHPLPVSSALLTSLLFMPAQVIKVPGDAVLRGCKKTRRKLMAHFQLRAGVHPGLQRRLGRPRQNLHYSIKPAFDDPSNQELLAKLQQLGSANFTGDLNTINHHSMQLAVAMQQHYSNPGKWWW